MRTTYHLEVDALRIRVSRKALEESDEETPGIILDYDKAG